MKSKYDLHIHSTASDGAETPEEIVRKAKEKGLKVIALADHDSISGVKEAREEAEKLGIKLISCVELNVRFYHELCKNGRGYVGLHILGYGIDIENKNLNNVLDEHADYRRKRARMLFNKLNEILESESLQKISLAKFIELETKIKGSLGKPHLAELLINEGIVNSVQEAFDKYFTLCRIPLKKIDFSEGVKLLKEAGGTIVLAHPFHKSHSIAEINNNFDIQKEIIKTIKEDIDGIEVFYWDHKKENLRKYLNLADEFDLKVSVGSDHHGKGDKVRLGELEVPDELSEEFGMKIKDFLDLFKV